MIIKGLAVTVVTVALMSAPGHAAAEAGCTWEPTVLPVPPELAEAGINAGDGDWFAGWGAEPGAGPFDDTPGVRWRGDVPESLGLAFDQPTNVYGVSPNGVVAGAVLDASWQTSAVVHRGKEWTLLPKKGTSSWAYDVNAEGFAVGYDNTEDLDARIERLTVWPPNEFAVPRVLPAPAGRELGIGHPRIDDDGTVVAPYSRFEAPSVIGEGYVWRPGAPAPTRLAPLSPDDSVSVTDLRGGHIVGTSNGIGVEWNLGGEIVRKFDGRAEAVNRDGFVLGTATDGTPVVWAPDGAVERLTEPTGYSSWSARAFGDRTVGGQASVGSTTVPVTWQRAC